MDLNVYSGAIGSIIAGSRYRLHKTSCKDNKIININVLNTAFNRLALQIADRDQKKLITTGI